MRTDLDLQVAALAARQHGCFTLAQALAIGLSRDGAKRRVANGRWGRMWPGVYRLAGTPPGWEQTLFAAWLAAGAGAAVSGRAAGGTWEFPRVVPRLEITVPPARRPRLRNVVVHRAPLAADDVVERAGLVVTTPTRTIIDLAGTVPPATLGAIVDHCFSRRLASRRQLLERLAELGSRGRAGALELHELLEARPSERHRPHEEFERRLAEVLEGFEPQPVYQHEVVLPNGKRRRLDVAWPAVLFALEANSYLHHSSLADWARDHTRSVELIALGWRIMPVTWPDLDEPAVLLDRVARALDVLVRNPHQDVHGLPYSGIQGRSTTRVASGTWGWK